MHILKREALWPLIVLLLGAAVLLPGLGRNGFWEQVEIGIADRAKSRMKANADQDQAQDERAAPARNRARAKQPTVDDVKPPLTLWSAAFVKRQTKAPVRDEWLAGGLS